MSTKNVTLKEKVNGAAGNVLFPATTTPNVYDSAKSQALSQTLVNTPDYEALGFAKFSTATAYNTGDKVYKDNGLYRFIADKTAGEWDVAKVEPWSIEQEIEDVDDAIRSLIPAQASADNKLADKEYVNDKVSTDTATFRGTFNLVTDLELTTEATQGQIATALGTAISGEDKNDYAFVLIPTSDATPTEIARIDRYKYTGLQWAFEYSLNNSGFTAEQWAAINSGITSSLVTAFGAKYDKPDGGIPASDMNTSTFDDEPTAGSNNLVKSGGVAREFVNTKKLFCNDSDFSKSLTGILDYYIAPGLDLTKEYYIKYFGYKNNDKTECFLQIVDNLGVTVGNTTFDGSSNEVITRFVLQFQFIIDTSALPVNTSATFIEYNYHLLKRTTQPRFTIPFVSNYLYVTDSHLNKLPIANSSYKCLAIRVYEGETYTLRNCVGDTDYSSPFATYNENFQLVRRAPQLAFEGRITIQSNEKLLVVNTKNSNSTVEVGLSPSFIKKHCFEDFYFLHSIDLSKLSNLEYAVHGILKKQNLITLSDRLSTSVKLTGFAGKTVQMVLNSSNTNDRYIIYGCTDSGAIDVSTVLVNYTKQGTYTKSFIIPNNEYIWIFTEISGVQSTFDYTIIDYYSVDNQIRLLFDSINSTNANIFGDVNYKRLNFSHTSGQTSRLSYALKLTGKSGSNVYLKITSTAFENVTNGFTIYGCNDNGTINTSVVLTTGIVNQVSNPFVIPTNEYIWIFTHIDESSYSSALYNLYINSVNSVYGDNYALEKEITLVDKKILNLNPFYGKKIVCFGDSITEFKYNGKGYTDYLSSLSGATVINVGVGGTELRQRTTPVLNPTGVVEGYAGLDIINMVKAACNIDFDSSHTYTDVVTNAAQYLKDHASDDNTATISRLLSIDWSTINYVIVFAGTNDWTDASSSSKYGTSGSTDINTTLGAINEIIRLLLTTYPHLHLYWFTPIIRYSSERIPADFSDTKTYGGLTLKQLSAEIFDEVKLNHIAVCDLYNSLGWNTYNFSQYFLDNDSTHPYKGFKYLATEIFKFML